MPAPLLIADSGPLIALARLDLLHLPGRYFAQVFVTASVWEEVTRKPKPDEGEVLALALESGAFSVVADPDIAPSVLPESLRGAAIDLGERTVIALASQMAATVLIDDLRARRAAQQLAVPLIGTLSLLVRARVSGVVGPLRPLLDRLSASGYRLPAVVVEQILAELGE